METAHDGCPAADTVNEGWDGVERVAAATRRRSIAERIISGLGLAAVQLFTSLSRLFRQLNRSASTRCGPAAWSLSRRRDLLCLNLSARTSGTNASAGFHKGCRPPGKIHFVPMRYLMKQKLFAWGDDFTIKNAAGEEAYFVDGKAFSFGDKLSFQDMEKNELAFIRQKLLSWGPTYEITRGGELAAVVKKQLFTLFRCKFTVDVPGPDDLEAQGSFWDMEYAFSRGGQTVAEVSKRWFSLADTYGVDIQEGEDDVLILASTVVIDMVCHGDDKRH